MRHTIISFGLCALLCPTSIFAEVNANPEDPVIEMAEYIVTANRIPELGIPVEEFPGQVSVIDAEEIARSGANNIADFLDRYPGVSTFDSRGFGLGADTTVNLRGVVNSSRTGALVLIDGVRQNTITDDAIHWQALPLSQIERIEIIRGGNGVIYGEGALSGVINIVTKSAPEDTASAESAIEVGSYGRRTYRIASRAAVDRARYGVAYQRKDIGGYRESSESRTTAVNTFAGFDVTPDLSFDARLWHSDDTTRFSGGITPEQSQQRRRQAGAFAGYSTDDLTQVSLESHWQINDQFDLAATGYLADRETHQITAFGDFASFLPSRGLHLRAAYADFLTDTLRNQLIFGLDLADEKASTGNITGTYSESNKQSYGLFVENTLRIHEQATLIAGARFDQARFQTDLTFPAFEGSLRFQGWSPRLGASLDISDELTAYANFARPFKAPNVFDFSAALSNAGFPFVGNVDLQPQQGQEFEVGLHWRNESIGSLDAAWFHSIIDDEILFNALTFQNQNFDTRRIGLEIGYEPALPGEEWFARLAYTFIDAEFRKGAYAGNSIPSVPDHAFSLFTEYQPEWMRGGAIWFHWELVADFFRINDFSNQLPGDNYGVLDMGMRYTYDWATFYITVENVTDEEYTKFQSSTGNVISTGENPMPPRSYLAGMQIDF